MTFIDFMMIATIVIAVALTGIILIQGHTDTGLGSVFSGSDVYRTRRGMERTLFNLTFLLAGVFFLLALITVALE
jgi:preprotein translocase subunit SecG